jgi:hypothetical protein
MLGAPRTRARSLLFGAALALLASSRYAVAQPPARESGPTKSARESFDRGVALTQAGKIDEALLEFQRAYDESPNWKILYNIGQCSRYVGDHARSLRAFRRYLVEAQSIPASRRAEVEREIAELERLVGRIDVVAPAGYEITIDGAAVGTAPLAAPVVVNAGKRAVAGRKEGAPTIARDVLVQRGASIAVDFSTTSRAPAASAPPLPAVAARAEPTSSSRSTWIVAGWIATGALAVGAGVTGTLAVVTSDDLASSTYTGTRPPPELVDKASRVDTLATVTNVLVAGAAVTAAVSIVLMITAPSARRRSAPGIAPRPAVSFGRNGAAIGGAF